LKNSSLQSFAAFAVLGALFLGCGGGSANWKKINTFSPLAGGNAAYTGVQFVGGVGYVCGGDSFVGKSTDGGQTWRKLDLSAVPGMNTSSYFNALHFFDANDGWVVGNGWLLHTLDGGVTWTQTMPLAASLFIPNPQAISFGDRLHGVTVGLYGKALYTTDGGVTWQKSTTDVDYAGYDFSSVHLVDERNGWMCGSRGALLKTLDGGQSWTTLHNASSSVTVDAFTNNPLHRVQFLDAQTGYIAADNGMIKSTDGGASWTKLSGGPHSAVLYFVSRDVGFSDDQSTADGGGSWKQQQGMQAGARDMNFQDARTGWAIFGNGDLYKYE
jgi:photosystem II stability/assembly factor-like uncharacterized protein